MKQIGFKNFRRFAEEVALPLGDINLLVGGNNSGKSTVVKALLLITANLNHLFRLGRFPNMFEREKPMFNFAPKVYHDVLHIGTFNRAVNINHKDCSIVFNVNFNGIAMSLEILPLKDESFVKDNQEVKTNNELPTAQIQRISVVSDKYGIEYLLDFVKNVVEISVQERETPHFDSSIYRNEDVINFIRENNSSLTSPLKPSEIEDIVNLIPSIQTKKEALDNFTLSRGAKAEFSRLRKELQYILPILKGIEAININHGLRVSLPLNLLSSRAVAFPVPFISQRFRYYDDEVATIPEDEMNRIGEQYRDIVETLNKLTPLFREFYGELMDLMFFQAPEYIYAHAVSQKTLYPINSDNDFMSQTIENYFRMGIKENDPEAKLVEKWLSIFNIASRFEVSPIAGCEAFTVKLGDEDTPRDNWLNLAEKGMGSIQMFILLLKIATIICNYRPSLRYRRAGGSEVIVIVEEPEQNLHPSMQSLLADLFFEINQEFKIRFIIETHSEYLVRRAQVLCGEIHNENNKERENPFKVFYFPNHGMPYEMGMQSSGQFINNFNEGFFDVAAKLNMEVTKRERQRQRKC